MLKLCGLGRLERESLQLEKDVLLRKLLEAELDSNAAAKQVSALRDTVSRMSRSVSVRANRIYPVSIKTCGKA